MENKEEISEELHECYNRLSRIAFNIDEIYMGKSLNEIAIGFEMGKIYKDIVNIGFKIMEINNKLNGQ